MEISQHNTTKVFLYLNERNERETRENKVYYVTHLKTITETGEETTLTLFSEQPLQIEKVKSRREFLSGRNEHKNNKP